MKSAAKSSTNPRSAAPAQAVRNPHAVQYVDIATYADKAYLEYSLSVVRGRAIPDAEDGAKPVQRRILFAMDALRLAPGSKPIKSARVVGDVIGKYHPHGDGAVYDAMVRMAQPFAMRYPLVHGEGNFGNRDGDRAAAMRYTEVRLTPIAMALLSELDQGTVDFKSNFDGTLKEPELLPGRLPFLLLNGASGIAVGFATEFLSHNLREAVAAARLIIENPKTTLDELLAVMPGPDFPTGSSLISTPEEIRKVYEDGRGSLRLRARWRVEGEGKKWKLVFYELPQNTAADPLLLEIQELMDPKPREKKGKKLPLSPDQLRLKKLFNELVEDYQNGGGRDEPVRVVITPRDKKMPPEELAQILFAHTSLECNIPANFVALDAAGAPRPSTVLDWLGQWCTYRVETVRRRTAFEKERVDRRLHLLAGRLSILDRINEVIAVLVKSKDPKADLIEQFGLDDVQAEDVLEMRLRQVANLEKTKILDEQAKLKTDQSRLERLLASEKALKKQVLSELDDDCKQFGDDRRTRLEPAESSSVRKLAAKSAVAEKMAPEPVAVALTERGWIAWRPAKSWEEAVSGEFKIKAGDTVRRVFFGDRNDHLFLMDEAGKGYSLHLVDLPSRADTLPLTTWLEPGARIVEGAVGNGEARFILAGQGGYGFVVKGADWVSRMKAGKALLTLDEGETPLPPHPLSEVPETAQVVTLATDGRAVVFPLAELKPLPKGKGVALMGLGAGARVADLAVVPEDGVITLRTARGSVKVKPDAWSSLAGSRSAGKKGKPLHAHSAGAVFQRMGREELQTPAA